MHCFLRLRSQDTIEEVTAQFAELTWLLPTDMATRALTTPDLQNYTSTASAPSLRSREPVDVMERPYTPPDSDAGNVKVVVRVRKFIKRGGQQTNAVHTTNADILHRIGEAFALHYSHEPHQSRDDDPPT